MHASTRKCPKPSGTDCRSAVLQSARTVPICHDKLGKRAHLAADALRLGRGSVVAAGAVPHIPVLLRCRLHCSRDTMIRITVTCVIQFSSQVHIAEPQLSAASHRDV